MISKICVLGLVLLYSGQFKKQANSYSSIVEQEYFDYALHYGIFRIGTAKIINMPEESGCGYKLYAGAMTTGLAKVFRNLSYSFDCCMDAETGLPRSTNMNIHEKNYQISNHVQFDNNSRDDSTIILSKNSGQIIIKKGMLDILSGFDYFRKNIISDSMDTGKYTNIEIYFWDDVYNLQIMFMGKEQIKSKQGMKECLKFNPRTDIGRFFKTDEDMSVWFTNDIKHIPQQVIVKLRFGTIKAHLLETKFRE